MSTLISEQEWIQKISQVMSELESNLNVIVDNIGVGVFRLCIDGYELEFSSPRVEHFREDDFSHSNFTPEFISNLDSLTAFKRRDFKFNAIGITLGQRYEIIDPYEGLKDIQDKLVTNIDEDFFRDPVRFLRMIRFCIRFDFTINRSLELQLHKFNLSKLTLYYFKSEFLKSKKLIFFKKFFEYCRIHNLALPENIKALHFLEVTNKQSHFLNCNSTEELLAFNYDLKEQEIKLLTQALGLKYKNFLTMVKIANLAEELESGLYIFSEDDISILEEIYLKKLEVASSKEIYRFLNLYLNYRNDLKNAKSLETSKQIKIQIVDSLNQEKRA